MVVKKEKFGSGKVVLMSVAAVMVAVLLLAVVVVNGVSQVTQTFIRSNPETIDRISMINAALDSEDSDTGNLIMNLLWAKYVSGSVGGKIEGSFTGRFTTEKVRSLEKVNLSCIDQYEYEKIEFRRDNMLVTRADDNIKKQKMFDNGCEQFWWDESTTVFKCPLRNCQMREKTTEVAGTFIPERIDIRKVEAESTLNEGKG